MSYRITNRSDGPVLLRLRTGQTLHLAPAAQSAVLERADVVNNPRLATLQQRRLIRIDELTDEGDAEKAGAARRAPGDDARAREPRKSSRAATKDQAPPSDTTDGAPR